MFLQVLTRGSNTNSLEAEGVVKDPKNPNSVALLLVALTPAALPLLDARDPLTLLTLIVPLAFAGLAVWLLITGLAAEALWKESAAALKPKYPRKILGSVAIGLTAAGLILVHSSAGPVAAFTQGLIAAGLSMLAFGIDPLKNKGLVTALDRELLVLNPQLAALEARIAHITLMVNSTREPLAVDAAARVASSIRGLIRAVRLDPSRHRIARRHFGVIFTGFERSTSQFATLWATLPEKPTLDDFLDLSKRLEREYQRAAEAYARGGAVNLGIEASVLKELIKREAGPAA